MKTPRRQQLKDAEPADPTARLLAHAEGKPGLFVRGIVEEYEANGAGFETGDFIRRAFFRAFVDNRGD